MTIADLAAQTEAAREQAAVLLVEGFDQPRGWANLESAVSRSMTGASGSCTRSRHIGELRDLGSRDPFLFYLRLGYVVTGVMPDANAPGAARAVTQTLPDKFLAVKIN